MVDRIGIGQGFNLTAKLSPTSNNKTSTNFMDVLRNKFDEVTSKLHDVPGMPGVYAVNQADLASLNITDISDKTQISSLI